MKTLKKLNHNIYKHYINSGLFRKSKALRLMLNYREFQERKRYLDRIRPEAHYPLATLEQDGYAYIEPDADLTAELIAWSRQRDKEMENIAPRQGKQYFADLQTEEDYRQEHILMRFALQEKVLNTVAKYVGCAPFLESLQLIRSQPYKDQPVQSQLWHTDAMDTHMIKIFVYIDPVERENGPFTFMPASECHKLHHGIFQKTPYIADEVIGRYLDLSRKVEVIGPPGTAILVDTTNCYHYGSRCTKPRLVYTAYYSTGFGFHERYNPRYLFKWPELPDLDLSRLSPVQKFALGFVE